MQAYRSAAAGLAVVLAVVSLVLVEAGQQPQQQPQQPPAALPPSTIPVPVAPRMPLAPNAVMGASVTPALEGWFRNPDGTATILLGYSNRNQNQPFDIPIGPNNRIEPGGPDYGQPTHFLTGGSRNGRQYGVFSITVPKDFGTKKLTWTLVANGQPQSIAVHLPGAVLPRGQRQLAADRQIHSDRSRTDRASARRRTHVDDDRNGPGDVDAAGGRHRQYGRPAESVRPTSCAGARSWRRARGCRG
jgi:hypothetical protein